jgi:hypothetical protein
MFTHFAGVLLCISSLLYHSFRGVKMSLSDATPPHIPREQSPRRSERSAGSNSTKLHQGYLFDNATVHT